MFEDGAHVDARSVNFINNQKIARQTRGAQVGVFDLQDSHHGLIHGTHGNLGRQVAFGAFGRPTAFFGADIGMVVPPHLVIREALALRVPGFQIAGNGQYGFKAAVCGK